MRQLLFGSLAAIALGFTLVATPSAASATAAVTVSATMTSVPVHWMDDATFSVIVDNPGTDALTDVAVVVSVDVFQIVPIENATKAPTVLVGNNDDVLDPGERWEYTAVAPVTPFTDFDVSGFAPDRSEVTHTQSLRTPGAFYPRGLLQPVDFVFETSPQAPSAGDDVVWTVTATSRVAFDIVFLEGDLALMIDLAAGRTAGDIPISPSGDYPPGGDDILAVGETWSWTYEHVWESADIPLRISFHWRRSSVAGPGGFVTFRLSTDPPQVAPTVAPPASPTTTTPPTTAALPTTADGELPLTGAGGNAGTIAAFLVLLGLALTVLTRRANTPTA